MLVRLRKGEPLAKLAAQMGLTVQDSGFFTRPQGLPGHPQARSLTTAAFTLTPSHPYPDDPITLNGENFLLAYKERRQPTLNNSPGKRPDAASSPGPEAPDGLFPVAGRGTAAG